MNTTEGCPDRASGREVDTATWRLALLADGELYAATRLVGLALTLHDIAPSQNVIARCLSMHRSRINRHLGFLRASGWLARDGNTIGRVTRYRHTVPEGWEPPLLLVADQYGSTERWASRASDGRATGRLGETPEGQ